MHHNYIAGYSIKNDIFLSSTPNPANNANLTPNNNNNDRITSRLERTRPENDNTNAEKLSFRNMTTHEFNNTDGSNPNKRLAESFYYNNPAPYNQVNDPKDSLIIYSYKQGEDLKI
jgi:hypothetical protein